MYLEQQRKWADEVGLKIGDKVLIVAKADTEQGGWGDSWVDDMDETVGKIGKVRADDYGQVMGHRGVTVVVDGIFFNYPFFVLVKV